MIRLFDAHGLEVVQASDGLKKSPARVLKRRQPYIYDSILAMRYRGLKPGPYKVKVKVPIYSMNDMRDVNYLTAEKEIKVHGYKAGEKKTAR